MASKEQAIGVLSVIGKFTEGLIAGTKARQELEAQKAAEIRKAEAEAAKAELEGLKFDLAQKTEARKERFTEASIAKKEAETAFIEEQTERTKKGLPAKPGKPKDPLADLTRGATQLANQVEDQAKRKRFLETELLDLDPNDPEDLQEMATIQEQLDSANQSLEQLREIQDLTQKRIDALKPKSKAVKGPQARVSIEDQKLGQLSDSIELATSEDDLNAIVNQINTAGISGQPRQELIQKLSSKLLELNQRPSVESIAPEDQGTGGPLGITGTRASGR